MFSSLWINAIKLYNLTNNAAVILENQVVHIQNQIQHISI